MSAVERTLARWARWPIILALALASLLLMVALGHVGRQPGVPAATALDLRLGYTQAEAAAALAPLTPAQRDLAARAHQTLDVVYPLTYGALFALLLVRLWPRRRFWLLAPAAVLADLGENALLAAMYWGYPARLGLTPFASALTTLKWGLVGMVALLLLLGFARRGWAAVKGQLR